MRESKAAQSVRLVDHILRDFKLTDTIRGIDFTGRVWRARRVVGVARVANGDKVDVEEIVPTAEGVGVGCGRTRERQG